MPQIEKTYIFKIFHWFEDAPLDNLENYYNSIKNISKLHHRAQNFVDLVKDEIRKSLQPQTAAGIHY